MCDRELLPDAIAEWNHLADRGNAFVLKENILVPAVYSCMSSHERHHGSRLEYCEAVSLFGSRVLDRLDCHFYHC